MKKIFLPIPKTFAYAEILLDDEDFEKIKQHSWFVNKNPYGVRVTGYVNGKENYPIANFILNISREFIIDHKDRDPYNNQKLNLRVCTLQQNNYNKFQSNNTSGFKGVCFDVKRNKWRAQIKINKKPKFLGYFKNKEEAAKIYDKAAKKYQCEFAYLNFPEK